MIITKAGPEIHKCFERVLGNKRSSKPQKSQEVSGTEDCVVISFH